MDNTFKCAIEARKIYGRWQIPQLADYIDTSSMQMNLFYTNSGAWIRQFGVLSGEGSSGLHWKMSYIIDELQIIDRQWLYTCSQDHLTGNLIDFRDVNGLHFGSRRSTKRTYVYIY